MIKIVLISIFAMASAPAFAGNMIRVENSPRNTCKKDACDYAEWRIQGLPGIRFVINGYEDGVDETLYLVDNNGRDTPLLDVFSVTRNRAGKFTSAGAKLLSLPFGRGADGPFVWATFDHHIYEVGENCHPTWERRVPALLFQGEWRESNDAKAERFHFQRVSLKALVAQAKRSTPAWKGRLVCDGDCCGVGYPGPLAAPP